MRSLMRARRGSQSGFTLVEVMVTVFVVAVGLLAAAGLQTSAKKAAIDAMQRTTATMLAQDMVERIRNNNNCLKFYNGKTVTDGNTIAAPSCGSGSTGCSPQNTVSLDYAQWWTSLDGASETIANGGNTGGLRQARGCVRVYNSSSSVEVVVEWYGLSPIDQTPDSSNPDDPLAAECDTDKNVYDDPNNDDAAISFRRVLRLQAHVDKSDEALCTP